MALDNAKLGEMSPTKSASESSPSNAPIIEKNEKGQTRIAFSLPDRPELGTPSGSATTTVSVASSDQGGLSPQTSNGDRASIASAKSTTASVKFSQSQHPIFCHGQEQIIDAQRLRRASPSPVRFQHRVAFDNLPTGEATKHNTSSLTLNVRHRGYQLKRRSRTFMVGLDENDYSDYALVWLLENLVDDGDEVICVRVIEGPLRVPEKQYLRDAHKLLKAVENKNSKNRAINVVLEYSVGKLHGTFQRMIEIYQPSMLIVGTKGRSLGGFQGLVNSRNSFSKYCLQYSPVPVVVVRPDDKRRKKMEKRKSDPARGVYKAMLGYNGGKHESDMLHSDLYQFEQCLSPNEEAHKVAAALGLPAAFDPTIKPINLEKVLGPRYRTPPSIRLGSNVEKSTMTQAAPETATDSPPALINTGRVEEDEEEDDEEESGDEADEGDDEGDDGDEFEVVTGEEVLQKQKEQRLRAMESDEAAALRKSGAPDDEEDEDDSGESDKSAKVSAKSSAESVVESSVSSGPEHNKIESTTVSAS